MRWLRLKSRSFFPRSPPPRQAVKHQRCCTIQPTGCRIGEATLGQPATSFSSTRNGLRPCARDPSVRYSCASSNQPQLARGEVKLHGRPGREAIAAPYEFTVELWCEDRGCAMFTPSSIPHQTPVYTIFHSIDGLSRWRKNFQRPKLSFLADCQYSAVACAKFISSKKIR